MTPARRQWMVFLGERIGEVIGPVLRIVMVVCLLRGGAAAWVCAVLLFGVALYRIARGVVAFAALRPWRARCEARHCDDPRCTLVCLCWKGHEGSCHVDDDV